VGNPEENTVPDLINEFQSLPDEYQRLIRQAQETYQISVAPLQLLVRRSRLPGQRFGKRFRTG
jgi:hypothetical protein